MSLRMLYVVGDFAQKHKAGVRNGREGEWHGHCACSTVLSRSLTESLTHSVTHTLK